MSLLGIGYQVSYTRFRTSVHINGTESKHTGVRSSRSCSCGDWGGAEADVVDWHQRWHPIGVTSARRLSHSTVVVPAKIAAAFATQVL